MEYTFYISGETLNITQALFHYRLAEMLKLGKLVKIKLTKDKERALTSRSTAG